MGQRDNGAYQRLPVVVLVVANLVPLAGVTAWNWGAGGVLAFYWFEMGVSSSGRA